MLLVSVLAGLLWDGLGHRSHFMQAPFFASLRLLDWRGNQSCGRLKLNVLYFPFSETTPINGANCETLRPIWELKAALAFMRKGDTLVVWKLDRLARSMKQLIETIESFQDQV